MSISDDEIKRRYAAMAVDHHNLLADAYWEDRDRYAQHRTRDELNRLLHYGHIIPLSHGFTTRFVDEHYPGWTWNQLVAVLTAAGVYVGRGGSPPCCDGRVREVHFDSEQGWLVEWTDGRITVGQAPPGSTRPDPSGRALPVLDLTTGKQLEER